VSSRRQSTILLSGFGFETVLGQDAGPESAAARRSASRILRDLFWLEPVPRPAGAQVLPFRPGPASSPEPR